MSTTEQEALDAGTVWWEADIFTGRPRWRRLLKVPATLPERRGAVVHRWPGRRTVPHAQTTGKSAITTAACRTSLGLHPRTSLLQHDHSRDHTAGWAFPRRRNSAVVMKLASRNLTTAVTVMVPNSLGPGELLLHYGTEEQKDHYLPRLASGEEIPCFALTAPRRAPMRPQHARCRYRLLGRIWTARKSWACGSTGTSATSRWRRSRPCWAWLSGTRPGRPAWRRGGPRYYLRADPDRHAGR